MSAPATNDDTVDTVLMIADAFRAAMSEMPTHLIVGVPGGGVGGR